jgi:hypothetical protein
MGTLCSWQNRTHAIGAKSTIAPTSRRAAFLASHMQLK